MKIHQKGFLLIQLSLVTDIWDYDLSLCAQKEYALSDSSAINNLYIALNELSAAGLITRLGEKIINNPMLQGKTRLAFRYKLSDFGRLRMLETGLIEAC